MKTQRVTLLTSPDFKAFLSVEAAAEGISVAELVRTRCERRPTEEEAMLRTMTAELIQATSEAKRALNSSLNEAQAVLSELQLNREKKGSERAGQPTTPARRKASA